MKRLGKYAEARTTLAFKIRDSVAQSMLPQGWIAHQISVGLSKGANLVVTFMDWLAVQEARWQAGEDVQTHRPDRASKTGRRRSGRVHGCRRAFGGGPPHVPLSSGDPTQQKWRGNGTLLSNDIKQSSAARDSTRIEGFRKTAAIDTGRFS
jgi:hypothetical protein